MPYAWKCHRGRFYRCDTSTGCRCNDDHPEWINIVYWEGEDGS